jgi:hypothetical protein
LTQLSKAACYSKIEFLKVPYNTKLDSRINLDAYKEKLSKFTSVKDQRECFILRHDVTYG